MPVDNLHHRLEELGLKLPDPPKPIASYVPAVRTGDLLMVSGQLPLLAGHLVAEGSVPDPVHLEQAQAAARQCVLNGLAILGDHLDGDFSRLKQVIRVGVFVQSQDGFHDQAKVANGASDLLQDLLGDAGRHARAAVGVNALPLNASVEIEFMFYIHPGNP